MKKTLMSLAIATAMAAPAFAQGGTVLGPPQFQSYDTRGACESALAAERNKQRKDPSTRGAGYENDSKSEFNRASLTTTRCEEREGKFVVVYYANGFPS